MKTTLRNLFLGATLLTALASAAQPTLTEANTSPVIGDALVSNAANYVTPGSSGASQTWDLSSMTLSSTATTTVVTPSSTTYGSSFPNSTIALSASAADNEYWKVSATAEQNYGITQGTTIISYSNPEDILHFPFTYSNTYTDTWAATFTSGVTYLRTGTTVVTADSYGTLKLPNGTFTNVLRVHFLENFKDSANISGSPYIITYQNNEYMWYLPTNHQPIATVYILTSSLSGTTTAGSYANNITLGIPEQSNTLTAFNLFPNPVSTELNVNLSLATNKKVEINLINVLGESVGTTTIVDGLQGSNTYQISTSDLSAGIYFAQIKLDGTIVSAKRFIVTK